MCQNVVFLAQQANNRYISQCEHGTVHLLWDAVGLHLPAAAFTRLANHILETRQDVQHLAYPSRGHCRLQVNTLFLNMPIQDFIALADMVDEALPYVDCAEAAKVQRQIRLMQPHQLLTKPSLN